jgi:cytolysin-activating lysine-acyltransferase
MSNDTANVNGAAALSESETDIACPADRKIDPSIMAKLADARARLESNVGRIVLAMVNLPRYRHLSIADLNQLVLAPLLRDRVAIATAKGGQATAGIAIWASVSDEVEAKIGEQAGEGVFPIRLASDDWASGEELWLLDVLAPNRKLATAVLANFEQIAGKRPVKIHPVVARSVDLSVLEKMRLRPTSAKAPEDEAQPS